MRALTLLALLAATGSAAPVPFPRPSKPGDLNGLWEWTLTLRPGSTTEEPRGRTKLRVEDGRWTFLSDDGRGGLRPGATYAADLDRTKSPMWLDLSPATPGATKHFLGLLRVGKNEMRWAYGNAGTGRPADVRAVRPGEMVYVFERARKGGGR